MTKRKSAWAFDPSWSRVEPCDERGESLGWVYFESRGRGVDRNPSPRRSLSATLLATVAAAISVGIAVPLL